MILESADIRQPIFTVPQIVARPLLYQMERPFTFFKPKLCDRHPHKQRTSPLRQRSYIASVKKKYFDHGEFLSSADQKISLIYNKLEL